MRRSRFADRSQNSSASPRACRQRRASACRHFEDAGGIPKTFRPDDDVGVVAKAYALGVLVGFQLDLGIVEIRKFEVARAFHAGETTLFPKFEVSLLGVRVEHAITLPAAEFDGGIDNLAGQPGVAAFVENRKPLKLGEIGEIPDPQTPDGLLAFVTNQMRRRKIVAVELLFERTLL